MFNKILNLFGLGNKKEIVEINKEESFKRVPSMLVHEFLCKVDLTRFPLLARAASNYGETCEHNHKLKNVLIVDDLDIDSMYGVELDLINVNYNINPYEEYNIYQATGNTSGISAYKHIVNNKIDYAILDLTLGSFCKLSEISSQFVEIDGIDLAIAIKKHHPEAKILFVSAHILNLRHPTMSGYREKLLSNTGLQIEDIYINKLEKDKSEKFFQFLDLVSKK